MTSPSAIDQLNNAIEFLLADPDAAPPTADDSVSELVVVARELRYLPRAEFKASLKFDLEEQAAAMIASTAELFLVEPATDDQVAEHAPTVFPTLLGRSYGEYRVQGTSFAASLLLHAAAVALLAGSGLWIAQHREQLKPQVVTVLTEPGEYALPPAPDKTGGGGGGGDRDVLNASKGTLPRFAREQMAPPAIVLRSIEPKLPVQATVVGPPKLTFPQTGPLGNPLSGILTASNGTGTGGGIGAGNGGGVGSGTGPGVGEGYGGGIGGGVYHVGGGVSAPRVIYSPDPEFSDEARKAKYQGTVMLWAIIGPDGRPHDLRVQRSLGMGLDEKAIEAVRKWKFEPAMMAGRPVAVQIGIEVTFRLF